MISSLWLKDVVSGLVILCTDLIQDLFKKLSTLFPGWSPRLGSGLISATLF